MRPVAPRGKLGISYTITFVGWVLSFSVPSGHAGSGISKDFSIENDVWLGASMSKSDSVLAALRKNKEIGLTVTGRKTGKLLPRPVWFVVRGNELLLLPVTGTDSQWYKNILQNPQVKISASKQTFNGTLRAITEKKRVEEVIELFKGKYGASDIKKYYPKPNVAATLPID